MMECTIHRKLVMIGHGQARAQEIRGADNVEKARRMEIRVIGFVVVRVLSMNTNVSWAKI